MIVIENTEKLYQYIESLLTPHVYATVTIKIYDGQINHVDVEKSLNLKAFNTEEEDEAGRS
jgi:transcription antitermination factor NusA-like protein